MNNKLLCCMCKQQKRYVLDMCESCFREHESGLANSEGIS